MRQITIIATARAGLMADLAELLGNAGINIETLEAFVVREWDIVQLTVSNYDQALQVLRDAGYNAITEDAVVINVQDRPGALAQVTRRLYQAGVEMRSMRILHRQAGEAMVAISMDRNQDAMQLIDDLLVSRSVD
jgi:histidine decarboxylase